MTSAEQDLCRRVAMQEQDPLGVAEANARMLLEALKALNAAFLGVQFAAPSDRMPAIIAASDQARAAIAKAEAR